MLLFFLAPWMLFKIFTSPLLPFWSSEAVSPVRSRRANGAGLVADGRMSVRNTADLNRIAASIVRAIDQQSANPGWSHLGEGDLLGAGQGARFPPPWAAAYQDSIALNLLKTCASDDRRIVPSFSTQPIRGLPSVLQRAPGLTLVFLINGVLVHSHVWIATSCPKRRRRCSFAAS
jgi:hypothetical protein